MFTAHGAAPDCSNLPGEWTNQLGSTLSIHSVDHGSGKILGSYVSPSGTQGEKEELVGWINSSQATSESNVLAIAFSVQWGSYGSITSWTGFCENKGGTPTITTFWHLVRSSSRFTWDHMLTGSDVFVPKVVGGNSDAPNRTKHAD
ncbi:avidin/streptavidin family protein [Aquabacterium sp. A7-Y]|uniref:avidin/streptavidin family protein n=1 Tax=Aquabacterium sp. A7-Y TaxID=1349605 RepID=UPI00223D79FC|nr:avidin/streptavidin family protein [Aquabacterium sp. A7-Y]MCW7539664.1 avidin/streptavidin family protein [Aquabacterium sp. A7-Y]